VHDARMRNDDTTTITTLLALAPDLVERDRVRRQALRAGAVQHPGLAPLRTAAFAGEGLALTWEVPAGSRGWSDGDDPIAVLAPIAGALALLHDAGVAHGGVSADAVHVANGRGLLTGWRPGGTPAADVAALIALLDAWLPAGSVGSDVVQVLVAGADPDPAARPSMARVAAVLDSAATRITFPISPPAQRRARFDDAPPPRIVEPVAATMRPAGSAKPPLSGSTYRASEPFPAASRARGRHAAHRASAGSFASGLSMPRMPWRWGVAIAGAAVAAFLGLSTLGSPGSAQEMCPAPASSQLAPQAGGAR